MSDDITPVILCGGSGTRLWPLSRRSYPKQFAQILGETSLFQGTALRLAGAGHRDPIVVTNADFRFVVTQQLDAVGLVHGPMLIEPEPRNTAPAILAAALVAAPEDLLLVLPSDHLIADEAGFRTGVAAGVAAARAGRIVTFGVEPDGPETGYGYLEVEPGDGPVRPLLGFVEKPDRGRAEAMLARGGYLWNAGIFLFEARTLLAAAEALVPEMLAAARASVEGIEPDLDFLRLAPEPWSRCEDISIDFAIMEKSDALSVVVHAGDWTDLGGWEAVLQRTGQDETGVATHGPARAFECRDTLLRSETEGQLLVGLGLRDVVAVATPDAVLVADRSHVGKLGVVVRALRAEGLPQADTFPREHRPWGFFETLDLGHRFRVKRIVVRPGAALSLQSHVHRAEHWVVVVGTARVTIDGESKLVGENESAFIPLGAVHRLENPGKLEMEMIEVQTGSYLAEDDITRYEDAFARS